MCVGISAVDDDDAAERDVAYPTGERRGRIQKWRALKLEVEPISFSNQTLLLFFSPERSFFFFGEWVGGWRRACRCIWTWFSSRTRLGDFQGLIMKTLMWGACLFDVELFSGNRSLGMCEQRGNAF